MKHTLKVWTYSQDGGDGGGSASTYGSLEALKEGSFDNCFNLEEEYYEKEQEELDERFQHALAKTSMYEYGEISEGTMEVDIEQDETGKIVSVQLVGSIFSHWGQ